MQSSWFHWVHYCNRQNLFLLYPYQRLFRHCLASCRLILSNHCLKSAVLLIIGFSLTLQSSDLAAPFFWIVLVMLLHIYGLLRAVLVIVRLVLHFGSLQILSFAVPSVLPAHSRVSTVQLFSVVSIHYIECCCSQVSRNWWLNLQSVSDWSFHHCIAGWSISLRYLQSDFHYHFLLSRHFSAFLQASVGSWVLLNVLSTFI